MESVIENVLAQLAKGLEGELALIVDTVNDRVATEAHRTGPGLPK